MFISHKSNVIQHLEQTDFDCRRKSKGQTLDEYWEWVKTITDSDGVVTYPSEDFTIVKCTDEDVQTRIAQLVDYINYLPEGTTYNIKYYVSKRDAEELLDIDGKSYDPEQYVQSHFVPDDTARDKRILDEQWEIIRRERDRLLIESDWTQGNDTPLSDADVAKWKTYRTSLRDLPSDQSSKTKYSDITWPTKP